MPLEPEILVRVFTPVVKPLALAVATIAFAYTTPPYLYAPALGRMGLSYRAAYVVQLGLRCIPEFVEEMGRTLVAQMARGYKPKGGGDVVARIAALAPLVVPVTISATLSICYIADAVELRGFSENECRTWFRALKFGKADFAAITASAVLAAAYAAFHIFKPW